MKYPKEYLDEIKTRLKVSTVVSKTVSLKKRGKEFVGLSPFKNEKTPSFTVNDEKEFYHCFATSEHGNIFDFVMKIQNLRFGEAVKHLAQLAGMQPYMFSKQDEEREKKWKEYQSIFSQYVDFYHNELLKNESYSIARDYLKNRSLTKEEVKKFKIGYIEKNPNFFEKLKDHYSEQTLVETGLFYLDEKKKIYVERFRGRLVFPINNISGQPIALGGRIIENLDYLAKYINSPETNFFKKGFNLFNLNNAKKESLNSNNLILVEGYMDVVSLFNKGIKNVSATLGTAMTTSQISLAWKNFDKIIICFDGDQSGIDASYRAAERILKILKPGKDIYFAKIPNSQDPDDFVNQFGKEGFNSLISQSKDLANVIFNHNALGVNKSKPSDIALLEKNLFNLADEIEDQISKKYIKSAFKNKIFENIIKKKNYNSQSQEELKKASLRLMLSKEEIVELSFINLILNYPEFSENKIEDISLLEFNFKESAIFISELINSLVNENIKTKENLRKKLSVNFDSLIKKIEMYSNNKSIISKLEEESYSNFFNDYVEEINLAKKNKQISSLESELLKNPDEASYNQYLSLKNS